ESHYTNFALRGRVRLRIAGYRFRASGKIFARDSRPFAMIPATEALDRLRAGNARFVASVSTSGEADSADAKRPRLTTEQEPIAIILGCSDARVPAEIVFDQGLGDLFVIRVAGNIVAASQIGSIEFAAERFHTRLVVVM